MVTAIDSDSLLARLRSVHGRGRVADALLGVALDMIEPLAVDYLSADEYMRLCGRVQATIDAATDVALATIAVELARVAEADSDLTQRLQRASIKGRTG
jgi:hypothetical protein